MERDAADRARGVEVIRRLEFAAGCNVSALELFLGHVFAVDAIRGEATNVLRRVVRSVGSLDVLSTRAAFMVTDIVRLSVFPVRHAILHPDERRNVVSLTWAVGGGWC